MGGRKELLGDASTAWAAVNDSLGEVDRAVATAKEQQDAARKEGADAKTKAAAEEAQAAAEEAKKAAEEAKEAAEEGKEAPDISQKSGETTQVRSLRTTISYYTQPIKDREFWRYSQETQRHALQKVRDLRAAFKKYETECRTVNQSWIGRIFDRLRRTWVGKMLLSSGGASNTEVHEIGWESAYFAVMGGYTFCPLRESPNPANQYTLSPEGLLFLLRQDFITPANLASLRSVITDKEKSNTLAKVLVCIQAAWMVLDCITRKIAGLPLTLLELNVITHVTCALMVYVCWWEKPHNVGQPITISETLLDHDSWALVYTMDKYGPMLQCAMEEPELPKEESEPPIEGIAADDNTSHDLDKIENPPPPTSAEPSINAAHGVSYHRGYTLDKRDLDNRMMSKQDLDSYISTERELDICAAAARKMRPMIKDGSQLVACGEGLYPLSTPNVRMLYNQRTLDTTGNLAMLMLPLCLLYGGLHATAWNSHFPTPIERLLWRISCILIGTPGIGAFAIQFAESVMFRKERNQTRTVETIKSAFRVFPRLVGWILVCLIFLSIIGGSIYGVIRLMSYPHTAIHIFQVVLLIIASVLVAGGFIYFVVVSWMLLSYGNGLKNIRIIAVMPLTFIYCCARTYIFIECFISIRSLPVGAYKTVVWENFWPHI